jgi:uncharacterized protein (DUF433 family)
MDNHFIDTHAGGKPVIAGTHVTVEDVLKELAVWGTIERILTAHPELHPEAVRAALEFAAEKVHEPVATPDVSASPESQTFTPCTPFGKQMWALHQAIVAEAEQRGEPLLETWEDLEREVRERRGERDNGIDL